MLFFLKSTYQIPLICKVRIGWVLAGFGCLFGGFRGDRGGFVAALESAESELLHCTVNLSRGKKRMWWVSFHSYSLHLKRERKRSSSDPSSRMNDASAHYERSSEALACELETPLLLFSWSYCWKSMHFYISEIYRAPKLSAGITSSASCCGGKGGLCSNGLSFMPPSARSVPIYYIHRSSRH